MADQRVIDLDNLQHGVVDSADLAKYPNLVPVDEQGRVMAQGQDLNPKETFTTGNFPAYTSGNLLHAATGLPGGGFPMDWQRAATRGGQLASLGTMGLGSMGVLGPTAGKLLQTGIGAGVGAIDSPEHPVLGATVGAAGGAMIPKVGPRSAEMQQQAKGLYTIVNSLIKDNPDVRVPIEGFKDVLTQIQARMPKDLRDELTLAANQISRAQMPGGRSMTSTGVPFRTANDLYEKVKSVADEFPELMGALKQDFATSPGTATLTTAGSAWGTAKGAAAAEQSVRDTLARLAKYGAIGVGGAAAGRALQGLFSSK